MRALGIALLAGLAAASSCTQIASSAPTVRGGDAGRGRAAIARYGCVACHQIPGIPGPKSDVGPRLADLWSKPMIAGRVANTPDELVHWIRSPQELAPGVDMPDLGVDEQDARDIAQYLYHQR